MKDARRLRVVAALALVIGAGLFAFGVAREHSGAESREGSSATVPHEEGTEHAEGGEADEHVAGSEEADGHAESDTVLFGIDLESTPFVVVGVIVSVALAGALLGLRSRAVLGVAAVFALAFAIADVREVLTQLDESHGDIAAIAGVVLALHAAAAVVALAAWRRSPSALA